VRDDDDDDDDDDDNNNTKILLGGCDNDRVIWFVTPKPYEI
jgi:hypothetical protein